MRCPTLKELPPPPENKIGWPWNEVGFAFSDPMTDSPSCPQITVVTASYNQGKFLEETIRSVLLQGYPNLEYLIMDGGSTDESLDIIRKYEQYLTYWISERDNGQSEAINKGFAKSHGTILCWLNSDDFFRPGTLETVAQHLRKADQVSWLIGHTNHVNEESCFQGTQLAHPLTYELLFDWPKDCVPQQSTFWTRAMWERVGLLDDTLHYSMDLPKWFDMFAQCPPIIVDKVLACFRIHTTCKGVAAPFNTRKEVIAIYRTYLKKMPDDRAFKQQMARHVAANVLWWAHDSYHRQQYEHARYYLRSALRLNPALLLNQRAIPLIMRFAGGISVLRTIKKWHSGSSRQQR